MSFVTPRYRIRQFLMDSLAVLFAVFGLRRAANWARNCAVGANKHRE
jgi:hypothetical protein